MTGYVVRPTRIASKGIEPHVSARAASTEQGAKVSPVPRLVTQSAAVQHGMASPSPAGRAATDNVPAGTVVIPSSEVLMDRGGITNASAPATEETTQGADARHPRCTSRCEDAA